MQRPAGPPQTLPVPPAKCLHRSSQDSGSGFLQSVCLSLYTPPAHLKPLRASHRTRNKAPTPSLALGLPGVSHPTFSPGLTGHLLHFLSVSHTKLIPTSEPPSLLFPLPPDLGVSSERPALTTQSLFLQHWTGSPCFVLTFSSRYAAREPRARLFF